MIVSIMLKIANNEPLTLSEREELSRYFEQSQGVTTKMTNMTALDELAFDLGEIYAGRHVSSADPSNNDVNSPTFTGTYMDASGVTGKNNGTVQAQLRSSDGKITAGGGVVTEDETGISIIVSSTVENSRSYKFKNADGDILSGIRANQINTPAKNFIYLSADKVPGTIGYDSNLLLTADAHTGKYGQVIIQSKNNTDVTGAPTITLANNGTVKTITVDGATSFNDAVTLGDSTSDTITVNGTPAGQIASGTYTPTLTNVTNVAGSTAYSSMYMRIGNLVHVDAIMEIDPTATGLCRVGISLPIASNFAAATDCNGVVVQTNGDAGQIIADATNDRADLYIVASNAANLGYRAQFTYRIL